MTLPNRYPHADILAQREHWDDATREVVLDRVQNVPAFEHFGEHERATLEALCARVIPQGHKPAERRVPIAPWIDQRYGTTSPEGFQFEDMPSSNEAWDLGLRGLDETAEVCSAARSSTSNRRGRTRCSPRSAGEPAGRGLAADAGAHAGGSTSRCARSPACITRTPMPGTRSGSAGRPTRAATLR